jgi:transposase
VPNRIEHKRSKAKILAEEGTLNPAPEKVGDPKFQEDGFFDPRDIVQVKYEMLRRVFVDKMSVTEASDEYGVSRPTFYQARADFDDAGLGGLVPRKRGPRGPHKLQGEVLAFLKEQVAPGEPLRARELTDRIRTKFGLDVHPRTIERALGVKNCVIGTGPAPHSALQDRATERYEILRAAALGTAMPVEARSGLTILLHRGTWAWVRAILRGPCQAPCAAMPVVGLSIADEPSEKRTVIHLLAAMVMAAPERRRMA